MELFRLMGSIFINSDEADKSLQKTDKNAQSMGNTLAKGIGTAVKWGAVIGTAAIAGGVAILGMANKTAQTTDRIDKLSQKLGVSRKGFQEWDYILSQNGTSIDTMGSGMKTLTKLLDDSASNGKKSTEVFKKLGISLKGMNQEQAFESSVKALQGMKDGAEKSALALDLFGKSGQELMPLLNGTGGSVDELRKKAQDMGLVLSDSTVDAGVKFTDTMDNIKRTLGSVVAKVGAEVMPIVQSVLDWVLAHMPEIQAIFSVVFGVVGDLVKAVGGFINNILMPAFTSLYNWIQPNIPAIQSNMQTAFGIIKTVIDDVSSAISLVIDWCIKYKDILIPLGVGIAAGTLAFGLYTLAINAGAIATGIWATVTGIATGVGTAFGAVLAFITSPIGLVVIAIGLLVAAGVLLYKNWDTVKSKATQIFGAIGKFIGGIVDGIKNGFKGMVNGVISALNYMIRALNKLKFEVPDWVPGLGGKGFGFNIPTIPSFAIGTKYLPSDMLIQAHKGEMIVPKSENPYANSDNGQTLPNGGLTIKIENFVNNRKQDVEAFAEELEFYRKQKSTSTGGAY